MTIGIELERLMRQRRLPVQGVKVGITTDKETWEVEWRGSPEDSDIDEAQAIIDAYQLPEPDLETFRAQRIELVDQHMERLNRTHFSYEGHGYCLSLETIMLVVGHALTAQRILRGEALVNWPGNFRFIDVGGEAVPFEPEAFLHLADAATLTLGLRRTHAASLKKTLLAAGDHAAIRAVDLEQGWP